MKFLVVLALFISSPTYAATLNDFYQSAIENTATIKDRILAVEIAKEQKSQAIGGVLPEISATSNNVWRDQADVGAFGEAYQHSAFLSLKQPLFQGGSEYYAIGVAKNLPKIAELQKKQEQIALYVNVAQAYYNLLQLQKDKETFEEQKKTLEVRIKTLKRRARIGQNKATDVLASQSQLARVLADQAKLERNYLAAKNTLHNLTGKDPGSALKDSHPIESLNIPKEWNQQIMQTPLIAATELELKNAQKTVSANRGKFLPSIGLDANYYLDRAGILKDSQWDVGINATWNLYAGGKDASEKRISSLQESRIEARYNDLKRTIQNEYDSLRTQLEQQKMMVKKLKLALSLTKKNYNQYVKEADRGLISQLEVLRILEDRIEVQRAYDQEVFNTKVSWIKIKSLAGILP